MAGIRVSGYGQASPYGIAIFFPLSQCVISAHGIDVAVFIGRDLARLTRTKRTKLANPEWDSVGGELTHVGLSGASCLQLAACRSANKRISKAVNRHGIGKVISSRIKKRFPKEIATCVVLAQKGVSEIG